MNASGGALKQSQGHYYTAENTYYSTYFNRIKCLQNKIKIHARVHHVAYYVTT